LAEGAIFGEVDRLFADDLDVDVVGFEQVAEGAIAEKDDAAMVAVGFGDVEQAEFCAAEAAALVEEEHAGRLLGCASGALCF
jgi:hypothetical protein